MEYVVGASLALGVAAFARMAGFDRDRAFYPTALIVIASYYELFGVIGDEGGTLFVETGVFIAFIAATVAAENRAPFDILEAESELVAGFRVEYSGMKFALIQLGEYAHVLGSSFLGALLFLGAWSGPGPEWLGPIWFLIKAMFVFLLVTWVRWSFVRIRVDQILALSWKALLPATLALLIATAFVVVWRTSGAN